MARPPLPPPRQLLVTLIDLRVLAEEGRLGEVLPKAAALFPTLSQATKLALAPFFTELFWSLLRLIEQEVDRGNWATANSLAESARTLVEETPARDDFKSLLQQVLAPRPKPGGTAPAAALTAAPASEAQGSRARLADALLHDYGDELAMAENQLEQEFLHAVKEGSDAEFRRKEKLRNRLQRRTRWGGREPYKTTLKLLDTGAGFDD